MTESKKNADTDFGYERVPWNEKQRLVRGVFDSVAGNYDLMNDLMSGGLHRLWKRFALLQTGLRPGQRALDVATGTGDLGAGLARQVGRDGLAVLTDINREMLARGRDRLIDKGLAAQVSFLIANAECLPFLPDGASHLLARLGDGDSVGPAGPVFRRLGPVANGTTGPEWVNVPVTSR